MDNKTYTAPELCQQFTVEHLRELLGISKRTARRYQSGRSKPRRAELRLLELELRGRIMPESWPCRFVGDCLSTGGATKKPLTYEHLYHINWLLGEWNYQARFVERMGQQLRDLQAEKQAESCDAFDSHRQERESLRLVT